jgi:hypothetical protein
MEAVSSGGLGESRHKTGKQDHKSWNVKTNQITRTRMGSKIAGGGLWVAYLQGCLLASAVNLKRGCKVSHHSRDGETIVGEDLPTLAKLC